MIFVISVQSFVTTTCSHLTTSCFMTDVWVVTQLTSRSVFEDCNLK